jgi:hypothetical protein
MNCEGEQIGPAVDRDTFYTARAVIRPVNVQVNAYENVHDASYARGRRRAPAGKRGVESMSMIADPTTDSCSTINSIIAPRRPRP